MHAVCVCVWQIKKKKRQNERVKNLEAKHIHNMWTIRELVLFGVYLIFLFGGFFHSFSREEWSGWRIRVWRIWRKEKKRNQLIKRSIRKWANEWEVKQNGESACARTRENEKKKERNIENGTRKIVCRTMWSKKCWRRVQTHSGG